ncbi:MAG TPA: hypothetical protein VFP54_06980 [Acidimicrobiales bacterium]|nr:hypothetical protein [Acidimicrobiales bacterium]
MSEVEGVVRRTMGSALILGVLAVAGSVTLGHPLVGVGAVAGLATGLLNNRVYQATAARFTSDDGRIDRRPFGATVLGRLGLISAVALVLVWLARPVGWGMIGGLAVFQMLLLFNMLGALLAYQRTHAGDAGA